MNNDQIKNWVAAIFGILVAIAFMITPPTCDPDDPLTWDSSSTLSRYGVPLIIGLLTWMGVMIGVDAGNGAVDGHFARTNHTERLLDIPKVLLLKGRIFEAVPRSQYRRRVRQLEKEAKRGSDHSTNGLGHGDVDLL